MLVKRISVYLSVGLAVLSTLILDGCSYYGENPGDFISGIAATGAPLGSATVTVTDSNGAIVITAPAYSDGTFMFPNFSGNGPFLLSATGIGANGDVITLHSIATSADFGHVVNITPLTDVIVSYAAGQPLANCAAPTSASACLTAVIANLGNATTQVTALVAPIYSQLGIPSTSDLRTTAFKADNTGLDRLLDILIVTPPAVAGGDTAIALANGGTTPVILGSVPATTAANVQPSVLSPSAIQAAITQAQKVADAIGEIATLFTGFSNLFATSLPTASQLAPYLDASFLENGENAAAFEVATAAGNTVPVGIQIGFPHLAPYSGAPLAVGITTPGASVTMDSNGCPIAVWVMASSGEAQLLKDVIPAGNAPGTCIGGTWTWAGNQRQYRSQIVAMYMAANSNANNATSYSTSLQFDLDPNQTTGNQNAVNPYSYATITATPGTTNTGGFAGGPTPGTILLTAPPVPTAPAVLPGQLAINDPSGAYGNSNSGNSQLRSCTDPNLVSYTNPMCFNAGMEAGMDYIITFYDVNNNVLETDIQRLAASPNVMPLASMFPTITGVTPANLAAVNAAPSTFNVTTTWTLPLGAESETQNFRMLYASGAILAGSVEAPVSPTATSNTIKVTKAATANSASTGILISINGMKVGAWFGL